METSDARDQILECQAEIEDMDEDAGQMSYQQQELDQRIAMLQQLKHDRMMQR